MTRAQRTLTIMVLTACADGGTGTAPVSAPRQPSSPAGVLGSLRGMVDGAAGTLTFEPLPTTGRSPGGVGDLQPTGIYGDQGVTVRTNG